MDKSVYSLVLMDDVVAAVDRAAYAAGTNRSNMINRILAEYLHVSTPEQRAAETLKALEDFFCKQEELIPTTSAVSSGLALRSAIRYKYNPTLRYEVVLSGLAGSEVGELRVSMRTSSAGLIACLEQFFVFWSRLEAAYIPERVRHGAVIGIQPGRMTRTLIADSPAAARDPGTAAAMYIQTFDRCVKVFFAAVEHDPELALAKIENIYKDEVSQNRILL